ncbi:hypothetical protein X975_05426, partial [Stegodyphus mimosarum]
DSISTVFSKSTITLTIQTYTSLFRLFLMSLKTPCFCRHLEIIKSRKMLYSDIF